MKKGGLVRKNRRIKNCVDKFAAVLTGEQQCLFEAGIVRTSAVARGVNQKFLNRFGVHVQGRSIWMVVFASVGVAGTRSTTVCLN